MTRLFSLALGCLLVLPCVPAIAQVPIDTAMSFQGRIKSDDAVVNGLCDFEFTLWRDATSTAPEDQVGPTVSQILDVSNGLFSTLLDFGPEFVGDARWLQIRVRCPAGIGVYSTVTPRQELVGTPYAQHALSAAGWEPSGMDTTLVGGNVGIGTETPATALDVNGTITAGTVESPVVEVPAGDLGVRLRGLGTDTSSVQFVGSDLESFDSRMYWRNNRIRFRGGSANGDRMHLEMETGALSLFGDAPAITLDHPVLPVFSIETTTEGLNGLSFSVVGQGQPNLHLTTNGRVGVGTLTPDCALDVIGSVCSNGSPLSSDRRLKRDIEPIAEALDLVAALEGVRYAWRDDEFPDRRLKHGRDLGFIAQDVQAVLPDAVTIREDGFYALDYTRVVPVAIEAIKELHGQIEEKDTRIDRLEERVAHLEALILSLPQQGDER